MVDPVKDAILAYTGVKLASVEMVSEKLAISANFIQSAVQRANPAKLPAFRQRMMQAGGQQFGKAMSMPSAGFADTLRKQQAFRAAGNRGLAANAAAQKLSPFGG